ncbi:MAG: glycosyltransferase family 4 protein [Pseudomonadota bacterium]
MIKILAFTKYSSKGPSSRYRYYNYVDCFETKSLSILINPFFLENYLNTTSLIIKTLLSLKAYFMRFTSISKLILYPQTYGLIIIEYELFPYFPCIFERLLRLRKVPYIVDYDDAIFHRYDKHKNPLVRFLLKNKIAKVMKHASAVIVGNDYLQSYAQKYNNRILQLPTVVLLDKYKEAIIKHKIKSIESAFIIGWIGSKSTSPYVLDIIPVIEKFASKYPAECHLIGFDAGLISQEMQNKCKITIIPWSEETEIQEMLKFDVGIMPLKDDPWSKGKCGFKLIQYMSCKKPVIASPVGVNNTIVKEGSNGYLANTNEQWFDALEKLYKNKELRNAMGENNWEKILKDYNHQLNCQKYVKLINNIVKEHH